LPTPSIDAPEKPPKRAASYEELAVRTLRAQGHNITLTRMAVIKALAAATKVEKVPALEALISAQGLTIDLVTVYRVLRTFEEAGLIYRVDSLKGVFRRMIPTKYGGGVLVINESAGQAYEVPEDHATALYVNRLSEGHKLNSYTLIVEVGD
jgi:Fe2+ or Zn2+ uptake regulation protein